MSLQYQDRVSQILEHLNEHLETLAAHIHDKACGSLSVDEEAQRLLAWLEQMKSSYTTADERAAHRELTGEPTSTEELAEGEVAFF